MKSVRHIHCPNCGKALRLKVREESLGRKIRVDCKNCGTRFETVIPIIRISEEEIAALQAQGEDFARAINEAIGQSDAVAAITAKFRALGFHPSSGLKSRP